MVGKGYADRVLNPEEVRSIMDQGLDRQTLKGKKILVLTPDATRTAPLPLMVGLIIELLLPVAGKLDFMVALGTHPPLSRERILDLYGLTQEQADGPLKNVGLLNHRWDLPGTLANLGRLEQDDIAEITGGLFSQAVEVNINRAVFDYDLILILGPVFPHEVAGFSGGYKYFFPGISGGPLLHFTHWLGAVVTCWDTIGIRDTPVRRAIHRASEMVPVDRLCISMVVKSKTELAGLYVGETEESWSAATEVSRRIHIVYKDRPYHTVLGVAAGMYGELWVGGKVMYKLEPVVADGGRLILYGPQMNRISDVWGKQIRQIGYHTRDYFLNCLDEFKDIPLGVLAHSTHVKGLGTFKHGVEKPRIELILATAIPEKTCREINLGYLDPDSINLDDYKNREDEGVLFVGRAGEVLHRIAGQGK